MLGKVQYEVGFRSTLSAAGGELIRTLFSTAGFDLVHLVEQSTKGNTEYSFFLDTKTEAKQMLKQMKALKLRGMRLFTRKHVEAEWLSGWKTGWRPFALTKRFEVVPLWQNKKTVPKNKEPIFLETTSTFGTGLHETTRFSAELIESMEEEVDSFLDVGTGTGILTIVALKCGARRAVALDFDTSAVRVARANLKANRLSCKVLVADVKDYRASRPFDLVAANLISPDLIEFRERIDSFVNPGGALVISGISLRNIPRVRKAFGSPRLRLVRMIRGREWAALLYRKKSGR